MQEKLVADCSHVMVVVADERKKSKVLGSNWKKGVPLEILPAARVPLTIAFEVLYIFILFFFVFIFFC